MILVCSSCSASNRVSAQRLAEEARCGRCKTPLSPLDHPLAVASAADFDELTSGSDLPVLVDFWAAWCGPCRAVAPELANLAREQRGRLVVAKVDTEALPDLAARFAIRSIPTLMLFRKGEPVRTLAGAMPAREIERRFEL